MYSYSHAVEPSKYKQTYGSNYLRIKLLRAHISIFESEHDPNFNVLFQGEEGHPLLDVHLGGDAAEVVEVDEAVAVEVGLLHHQVHDVAHLLGAGK